MATAVVVQQRHQQQQQQQLRNLCFLLTWWTTLVAGFVQWMARASSFRLRIESAVPTAALLSNNNRPMTARTAAMAMNVRRQRIPTLWQDIDALWQRSPCLRFVHVALAVAFAACWVVFALGLFGVVH